MIVKDAGVPQSGVRVLFQHPDGTFETVFTDASGLARADMADGGTVHVIRSFPDSTPARPDEVYSYLAVRPGDRLENGHQIAYGTPTRLTVMVPATAKGTVTITTPCGTGEGTAPTIAIDVAGCPAMLDIYAEDQARRSLFAQAAYATTIDLGGGQLAPMHATSLSTTDVVAGTSVAAEVRVVDRGATLFSTSLQGVGPSATSIALPNLHGPEQLVIATVTGADGTAMSVRRGPYSTMPKIVDGTSPIPYVSATKSTLDAITWTEHGDGSADFAVATLDVTPAFGDRYVRAIVGPHVGSWLAIPQLPGFDAYYNIAATDQVTVAQAIVAAPGGYDAWRPTVFTVKSPIDAAPSSGARLALSYTGTLPSLP